MGNTLPFADGQIASIAMANDLILITRNVQDFSDITNLKVENWFE
jgi:tRNA(fMet)-specific endonuclease VapC